MVLEDKDKYRQKIQKIIESLEECTYVFYVRTSGRAYEVLEKNKIDIFLVDIVLKPENMSDISGLTFVENIRRMNQYKFTPVIFLSELEDPKLYAYRELKCFGYIQKPFREEALQRELESVLELPAMRTKNTVYFRNEGILYSVNSDDIIYIESIRRKLFIYTTTGQMSMGYETAGKFMQKINDGRFVRCSRYIIINVDYIQQVDLKNRYIHMKGIEQTIEIGSSIKEQFKDELKHRGTLLN